MTIAIMKPRYLAIGIILMSQVMMASFAAAEGTDWQATGCAGVVEAELEKMALDKLGSARVNYIVSSGGAAASEGNETLTGWVSFENCKGNLAVRLSESCEIKEMYTTGQCQIEGVPHY